MIGEPRRPGFATLTPYLMVRETAPVLRFLHSAFDATETYRSTGSAGGQHVEVQIGDSKLMLGGDVPSGGPEPVPVCLFVYVEDTDAVYEAALEAGASMIEPGPNFAEDRGAAIVDPFGNQWFIATHDPDKTRIER